MDNLIPPSYLAAGRLTFSRPGFSNGDALWSVSWGGANYTGPNTGAITNDADGNFAPPFAGAVAVDLDHGSAIYRRGFRNEYQQRGGLRIDRWGGDFYEQRGGIHFVGGWTDAYSKHAHACLRHTHAYPDAASVLGNISTRLRVETGNNVLIGGFIVTGTAPKKVIVRAIGPSLPLAGALSDTFLQLNSASGLIRSNDNWRSDPGTRDNCHYYSAN